MTRSRWTAALAVLIATAVGAPAQASDAVVGSLPSLPDGLRAWNGYVVFSEVDPATRVGSLMLATKDGIHPLPVTPQRGGFAADVGPDEQGRPVAVYSRCRNVRAATGCRIYRLSLAHPELGEQLVKALARPGFNDVAPSLWRGRIAFGRWMSTKANTTRLAGVYVQRRPGSRQLQRLAGGTIPACGGDRRRPTSPCPRSALPGSIDLGPRGLAVLWNLGGGNTIPQAARELWRMPLDGRAGALLDAGISGECAMGGPISFVTFSAPSIVGDQVAYLTLSGDCWVTRSAFTISGPTFSQRREHVVPSPDIAYAMARDGSTTWWVRGPEYGPGSADLCAGGACRLVRSTQVPYAPVAVPRRPRPPVE